MDDIIRVLRVLEYVGPRKLIEEQVANSIHGERRCGSGDKVVIRAVTIGIFPDVMCGKGLKEYEESVHAKNHKTGCYTDSDDGDRERYRGADQAGER